MPLFLALDLPRNVREALAHDLKLHQEKLDRQGLRWVKTERLNVALADLEEVDVEHVIETVGKLVKKHQPMKFSTTTLGASPDFERPSDLWLGIAEDEGTEGRAASLHEDLVLQLPVKDASSDFELHIALAQMKPASKPLGRIYRGYVKSLVHKDPEDYALPIAWTSDTVTLFESRSDGSVRPLQVFAIG